MGTLVRDAAVANDATRSDGRLPSASVYPAVVGPLWWRVAMALRGSRIRMARRRESSSLVAMGFKQPSLEPRRGQARWNEALRTL